MLDSIAVTTPRDNFIYANTMPQAQTSSQPTMISVGGFGSSTVFRAFAAQGWMQPLRQLGGVWGSVVGGI